MKLLAMVGVALIAGGVLTFFVNAGLTPLLQSGAPYPVTAASAAFLWRQSLSALATMLILIGSIGLYLRHADRAGRFGAISFLLTFVGGVMLFANEWCQVFVVRGLALNAPDALAELEAVEGLNAFDVGAIAALTTFTLGWLTFSASLLRTGAYMRRGPITLVAGFFAVPLFGACLPNPWGFIVGNAVLGAGWVFLGYDLLHSHRLPGDHGSHNVNATQQGDAA